MRGTLFDLILLPLITLCFGLLQARRSERRFRYWLFGWIFILAGIAAWGFKGSHHWTNFQDHLRLDVLIAGPLCFLLSFLPPDTSWRKAITYASILAFPAWGAFEIGVFGSGSMRALWLIAVAQIVLQAVLYRVPSKIRFTAYWPPLAICSLPVTLFLLTVLQLGPYQIYTCILMQMLVCAGAYFVLESSHGHVSRWIGSIGFATWALYYAYHGVLTTHPHLATFSNQIWNMPKYFVALGMLLRVMEEDTARLKQLNTEYRLLYEANPHPMWIFDPVTTRFLSVNDAAVRLYGYSRSEFLSMTLYDIRPEAERGRLRKAFQDGRKTADGEVWRHMRKDGSIFFVDLTVHDVVFQGHPARFVLTLDITDRENLTRELVYQAQHDALTGLPNRLLIEDRAQQVLSNARRTNNVVAIFTLDVDRFKSINDTFGHLVGDECLKAIATRLQAHVGEADTLARTGGEEFALVVGNLSSEAEARAIAGNLVALFKDPLRLSATEIKTTISVGVALFPKDGELLEDIRKQSDRALYQAKRIGGNRAVFLSDRIMPELENITHIENTLRHALAHNNIEVEYQPIFNAERRICLVEALVRVPALQKEGIGPDQFIPLAEESGLILQIGSRVLDIACADVAAWKKSGLGMLPFAVNVSCNQLLQADFADEVLRTLDRHHLIPEMLHLELTETTLMKDYRQVVLEMTRLASAGVRFSIDDFGTGYSSLERLTELPITTVKIDRSFTNKLPGSSGSLGIVQAICQMAKHLGLDVIAEGIETEDQRQILHDLGVGKLQGYLLSKPIKPGDLQRDVKAGTLRLVAPTFRSGETLRAKISAIRAMANN
ncbi:MAG: GGDEF domain-containing protein [Acidobacteria bacterium]|nr:GGDEF domain-containing protein [Acidobacteriota bacterium]